MTPAREKLLRLALAMPEEGLDVIAQTITWICPGLMDAALPAMMQDKAEVLDDLGRIARDLALREQAERVLRKMQRYPVPQVTPHDNVVRLFPAGRVRS
jgi:hypothetical protein